MDDFDFDETTNTKEDFDFDETTNTKEDFDLEAGVEVEEDILKQIDKKIVIKYMKEVKTSRTYIHGLDGYIKSKEEIQDFIKNIKKALGTSVIEKKDDMGKAYGFAGDHTKYIYDYIIKKNICPKNDIKK